VRDGKQCRRGPECGGRLRGAFRNGRLEGVACKNGHVTVRMADMTGVASRYITALAFEPRPIQRRCDETPATKCGVGLQTDHRS
jgi:hypothetical protein